jgi:hypothetical protein
VDQGYLGIVTGEGGLGEDWLGEARKLETSILSEKEKRT